MTNTIANEFPQPINRQTGQPANWLLRGLIGISIGIHLIVFMHVANLYHSSALTFIELTMEDISKPFSRDIPRPRIKPKPVEKPRDVKKLEIQKRVMPQFTPIKLDKKEYPQMAR
jgi:periplasmic protein TonB